LGRSLGEHLLKVPAFVDMGTENAPTPERGLFQTIFHVNRQNYFTLLACLETDHVIAAAQLARGLLEESIRWEWMTDDEPKRVPLLFGTLEDNLRKISNECAAIGVDPTPFLEPSPIWRLGGFDLTRRRPALPSVDSMVRQLQSMAEDRHEALGIKFPFNLRAVYAQYRVLCQFTHTSILGMLATVQVDDQGALTVGQDLPDHMWALVLHCGAASVTTVAAYTVRAFEDDVAASWTRDAQAKSFRIASLLGPVHGLVP
jgi:hypothetical protein